jgi:cytochrome bd ubiquinol oxidase subunit II
VTTVAALVLFVGILAYCIFGGADFGAGFWDLTAGGPQRGARPRAVIDHSIGPVWEANHVWLIFVFVVLWTGFPEAYQSIWVTMLVPLAFAALGIVLRGSSFAFRHALLTTRDRRAAGAVFASSSVLVPFFFGTVAGGIASGRVPAGGAVADVDAWINPTSILGGVLAVCATAFLAATYLVWDARRLADDAMVEYFRRRAFGAAIVSGAVAIVGIFVLRADAEYLSDGLESRALVFVIISAACGLGSLWLLRRDDPRGARLAAVGAVASIVVGWGVAQWDYILPESLTIEQAAAPTSTLEVIVLVTIIASVIVFPAIAWLFLMAQRGLLPEEGVAEPADSTPAGS